MGHSEPSYLSWSLPRADRGLGAVTAILSKLLLLFPWNHTTNKPGTALNDVQGSLIKNQEVWQTPFAIITSSQRVANLIYTLFL